MTITPLDFPVYLNIVLLVCLTIGGFFAFRNGKRTELTKLQKETIEALQQRTEVLEGKVSDLEKQNAVQQHIIDTVTSALEQEGRFITVNGDLVTISDRDGKRKVYRKRPTPPPTATTTKKEDH